MSFSEPPKGQLISKRLLEKIVWTKIATKKFDNFCPGVQIKKIKALSYINYGVFNVIKCPELNVNTGFSYFGPKLNNVRPKDIKNSKSTNDFTTNLQGWIRKNTH